MNVYYTKEMNAALDLLLLLLLMLRNLFCLTIIIIIPQFFATFMLCIMYELCSKIVICSSLIFVK